MKKYVLFYIISVLFACSLFSQSSNLDSLRMNAMIVKDTLLLKRILHDSLFYIHSNGLIETKSDFLTSITSGKIEYNDMQIQERKQRTIDRMGRSYTGIVRVIGKYKGEYFQVKLAFTSHYRRQGKYFKLIYWQSTKMTD